MQAFADLLDLFKRLPPSADAQVLQSLHPTPSALSSHTPRIPSTRTSVLVRVGSKGKSRNSTAPMKPVKAQPHPSQFFALERLGSHAQFFAALATIGFWAALSPGLSIAGNAPGIINHQGRITVNGENHEGDGFFKFSLIKDVGLGSEEVLWHHDNTATSTAEPVGEVSVPVSKGHYAVLLGATPMTEISPSVFANNDNVSLRIWFSTTSGSGFEHLSPDRRLTSTGYALSAATAAAVSGDGVVLSGGNLSLPLTTAITGTIRSGSDTLIHSFGTNNFFAGVHAGNLTMTGQSNTANGVEALRFNSTGSDNTATGAKALLFNTTGHSNTATGKQALSSNTTGDSNTAVGLQALFSNTEGIGNTGVGRGALYSNTTGINNTATGRGALFSNTLGYENTASGRGALYFNSTGVSNTAMGHLALHSNTTGNWNTASGHQALFSNTTGTSNSAYGLQALFSNTEGTNNTATGRGALYFNSTGAGNTAMGHLALHSNTTGASNSAIGREALRSNSTGSWNTASGHQALFSNATGQSNSAVGLQALFSNTTGTNNTGIGRGALYQNSVGSNNIAIGHQAGQNLTTGNNNIVIGNQGAAGESATIRIGNADQSRSFMAGIRGVTTGLGDALPVVIDSNGQLGTGGGAVDTDPSNEIQTLSLEGNQISLSAGGGTILLSDNNPTNELQTISLSGSTVTLSHGGGSFSINDADAAPNNEIQELTLTGDILQLSRQGGAIDLGGKVTSTMLADGSVVPGKIADGAVSGDVIADGGITAAKLSPDIPKLVQKSNRPFNSFAVHHNFNATNGGFDSGGFLPYSFSGPTVGTSTARLVLREKFPDDLQELAEVVAQIELSSGGCIGYVRLKRVNATGVWETVTEVSRNTSGVHTITIQGSALDLDLFQYFIEIELRSPANTGPVKINWCKISFTGIGI